MGLDFQTETDIHAVIVNMLFRLFYKQNGDLNDVNSISRLEHGLIEWIPILTVLKKSEIHTGLCEFTVNYT